MEDAYTNMHVVAHPQRFSTTAVSASDPETCCFCTTDVLGAVQMDPCTCCRAGVIGLRLLRLELVREYPNNLFGERGGEESGGGRVPIPRGETTGSPLNLYDESRR